MKTKLAVLSCLLLLAACQAAPPASNAPSSNTAANANAGAPSTAKSSAPVDLEQLAQRIVTQSAGVKEGEIVLISGYPQDQELLENIAINVRKVGAFPLVELLSERMEKRMYADVPDKYDSQAPALGMKLAETIDVTINVSGGTTEVLIPDADPKRLAARAKAGEPVGEAFLKNGVRSVEIGNGLYPTPWRAARFGMPEAELAKTFWEGVNVDYTSLQTRGEQVRAALAAGNELHITNPNGTDLKVKIQGRPVFVSDGIITEEDAKKGGGALNVFLPAGEVYVTPVPGTAEGKVVHSVTYFQGKEIQNLTINVSAGKVTSMTGTGEGFEKMKALYDATAGRKDELSFIDLGINPNVKLPPAGKQGNWVPAGMITVGIGGNTWAGGDNPTPYASEFFLKGSTVTLDGKTIIENGVLKI